MGQAKLLDIHRPHYVRVILGHPKDQEIETLRF
jgi:hypothetical protein